MWEYGNPGRTKPSSEGVLEDIRVVSWEGEGRFEGLPLWVLGINTGLSGDWKFSDIPQQLIDISNQKTSNVAENVLKPFAPITHRPGRPARAAIYHQVRYLFRESTNTYSYRQEVILLGR